MAPCAGTFANQQFQTGWETLEQAYNFLVESAVNLSDAGLRRSNYNKVAVNREILQLWFKEGLAHNLPEEQLFAHLAAESNVREPFKRLADTGVRLNLLPSVPEIQTFLVEEATELTGCERILLILEKRR